MSKPKTHVVIVLDRSSSMHNTKNQTIEGFNEQIDQIKENSKDQDILTSLVTFNGDVFEHLWNVPADKLQHANSEDYQTSGSTAMRDGMGYAIDKLMKTTNPDDENIAYMVIVISDGEENSSKYYNPSQLREMVEGCNSTKKWTFTYMGCSKRVVKQVSRETSIPISNCSVWDNKSFGLAKSGLKRQKDRHDDYYKMRASGQVKTSCLYSDTLRSCADFTQEDFANISQTSDDVIAPIVDINPPAEVAHIVDYNKILVDMKAQWCLDKNLNVGYREVNSGTGGYFRDFNQVVFGTTQEVPNHMWDMEGVYKHSAEKPVDISNK